MTDQTNSKQDIIAIFAKVYLFIKRYFIILLIFLIAGVALGIYKRCTSGFYYRNHLVINSIVVPKNISVDLIKSVQSLINESNTIEIAHKLNIPVKAASSLTSIDTASFKGKENLGFIADLQIRDSAFADTITSGLIYYLNNNKYYKENMQLYVKERQNILESINSKLERSDSSNIHSNSGISVMNKDNVAFTRSFSTEYINLLEKKYEVEKQIKFGSSISVVDHTMSRISTSRSLVISILMYGLGVGVFGVLLSLFIELIRLTRIYLKKQ